MFDFLHINFLWKNPCRLNLKSSENNTLIVKTAVILCMFFFKFNLIFLIGKKNFLWAHTHLVPTLFASNCLRSGLYLIKRYLLLLTHTSFDPTHNSAVQFAAVLSRTPCAHTVLCHSSFFVTLTIFGWMEGFLLIGHMTFYFELIPRLFAVVFQ